eukprot:TRINITY_DN41257_c0_g1_i1.p1 TRINITY_DN41257_c0_g1~~TRINITY_DN41257_c0_g1_i1.p1  ORF type:complete len:335 (+),score=77.19 TRINITY_DN41257_c0_g1_i1:59-1063(+)
MGGAYTKPQEIPSVHFPKFENDLPRLDEKVVAVTGCTTGTGYVCARTCAKKGAHVVMLNRKSERSAEAEKLLAQDVPGAKITAVDCDLQDFSSVRAASDKLKTQFSSSGIDVLCCNAGVMALKDEATKDGYDVQMQTNHLSHFLLTKELFPLLQKAAELRGEARVVQHSSGARNMVKQLEPEYLGKNGGNLGGDSSSMFFGGARWTRYGQTKLANAVYATALHEKLQAAKSKVKSLVVAPGLAATNLQVTTAADGGMAETWIMRWSQSGEDGTMPLLTAVAAQNVESGDFYEPEGTMRMAGLPKKFELSSSCTKPESCSQLWAESEKACGTFTV